MYLKQAVAYSFFLLSFLFLPVSFLQALTNDEKNNVDIFKSSNKSVVYVTNTQLKQDFFSLNVFEVPQGTGTGFVWNREGVIVTNYHVIQGANKITITLSDNTSWDADLVGVAPDKDVAVLKIKAKSNQLHPITIGNSNDLSVGHKVLAIGNPFGLDQTLTVGVVSALGREIDSVSGRKIKGVIQTDASINPGNSGGPLLNSSGELVGVNTAIYSPSGGSDGIGFAIPVNTVKKIVPQLIKHGKINRAIIGISIADDRIAERYNIKGVIIINVPLRSYAKRAGLKGIRKNQRGEILLGDIIIEVEGKTIKNSDDLYSVLENYKPGDQINIKTQRGNKTLQFSVRLSKSEG